MFKCGYQAELERGSIVSLCGGGERGGHDYKRLTVDGTEEKVIASHSLFWSSHFAAAPDQAPSPRSAVVSADWRTLPSVSANRDPLAHNPKRPQRLPDILRRAFHSSFCLPSLVSRAYLPAIWGPVLI